jgi:hypothetical protein
MDIKQGPSACAVLTVGKDMTFRDYAQGAFRMRQIGEGQTLVLYLIPEVENRMREELADATTTKKNSGGESGGAGGSGGSRLPLKASASAAAAVAAFSPSSSTVSAIIESTVPLMDVPAWLLLNSMRMEALQFAQLSTQELHNVWRKNALSQLVGEAQTNAPNGQSARAASDPLARLRRFEKEMTTAVGGATTAAASSTLALATSVSSVAAMSDDEGAAAAVSLRECVELFREPLGVLHDVSPAVPRPTFFADKVWIGYTAPVAWGLGGQVCVCVVCVCMFSVSSSSLCCT